MPQARTLYEPSTEHDSCGFGFVADVSGKASHSIVRDALTVLVNLEHRGASGSEANTGDGAGLLVAMPHRFLGEVAAEAGVDAPGEGLRRRDGLPAARRAQPRRRARTLRAEPGRRGPPAPRLARRAHGSRRASARSAATSQPSIAQAFIARPPGPPRDRGRRPRLRPPPVRGAPAGGEGRRPERAPGPGRLLRPLDVLPDDRLQGDAQRPPAADVLPGRDRRAARERHRPRPLALLDQHLPVVGPGAPVPLHQPQRRDQHAARERELDVRPPVHVHVVGVRRRPGEGAAGRRRRRVATPRSSTTCSSCSTCPAGASPT